MIRFRAGLMAGLACLSLAMPALVNGNRAVAAETPDCGSFNAELYQRVKPSTDANLVTLWANEADAADERYGFTEDHGVLAQAAPSDGPGLTAVWRLYRAGDFIWATDGDEADKFVDQGYTRQLQRFYAATEDTDCLDPIYRLVRGGMHRMASAAERDSLVADGWELEKTAFFARVDAPTPARITGTDTKFTLAVIPDTQTEVVKLTDPRFRNRAAWLADHEKSLDLRYALQVGDLVNWGSVDPRQFTKVSEDIAPLEAAVPWAGAIGNHDTAAVCEGGSACPGARTEATIRDTTAYNRTFPVSRFDDVRGTFESGKIDNAYRTFSAGGVDWMVLNLELWPRTSAVSWARSVVADHPRHNVIVVTHDYLDSDGSIDGGSGGYGATSPRYLYDNLIKVYPNIKLVLSGHVGNSAARTDTGQNGNKIVSLLQTFHSTTNPVRLVEVETAQGTITSRVYAPYTDTSYSGYSTSASGLSFVPR